MHPNTKITGLASDTDFSSLPRLFLRDGSLEGLKWLALLLMTGDHVNKYLFNGTKEFLFNAGRLAMPLFVFVLAYNLARPGALERGAYQRTIRRLALSSAFATPAFMALGGLTAGWWPLHILFTLLALAFILYLVEQGTFASNTAAAVVFVVAGSVVEFWWPALLLGSAVWSYRRQPSWNALGLSLVAFLALWPINGNLWALAAVPAVLVAFCVDFRIPRSSWVFYAYYPAHLSILWLARIPMRKAGYLFF